ncbi:MAG: hypothetical protein E7315_02275 [Clostridiales bacterium]|nr:hypothetical protein [Clostridiales bacterium]
MNRLKRSLGKIGVRLSLPQELVLKHPKITIYGTDGVLIENCTSISQYSAELVKINTELGTCHITGKDLRLDSSAEACLLIYGTVRSVSIA